MATIGCADEAGSADLAIEMDDLFFEPSEVTVPAGEPVTLDVINAGDVEHDIVITKEVFEISFEALDAIEVDPGLVVGRTDRVPPGGSASMTATFQEPGEYQYFCTIFGHFYQGMTGTITAETS